MRLRHLITVAAVAATVLAGSLTALSGATAAPQADRMPVANAQPDLGTTKATSTVPASEKVVVRVFLALRDQAAAEAAVRAVSDPSSADYTHYLTPAQFRARYSPTAATVAAVSRFLTQNGMKVTAVPTNHAYVEAQGTAAQAQTAFATSLRTFRLQGHEMRAAATQPTLPRSLATQVIGVSGLASISQLMTHRAPPPPAFVNSPPCSQFYGEVPATTVPPVFGAVQPYAPCGYVPDQLQGTYGVRRAIARGNDGSGVTVAITDAYAAPTIETDANTYSQVHGQPTFEPGQFTQVLPAAFRFGFDDVVNGDLCGEQGWYGEETLDVEAVHAMAPGADITYVASPSCDNLDFAITLINLVNNHLADIVTNSWGGTNESNGSPELDIIYHQIFVQAALEGIGFYFSSGDSADGAVDNNGVPTVQAPANDPLVTAVGGTSLAVDADQRRQFETGWSTGRSELVDGVFTPDPPGVLLYGAGGGTSRVFPEPFYQVGVVPDDLVTRFSPDGGRVVPDVSTVGDPNTGMLIGETQTFPDGTERFSEFRIGGTSLSSPIFAGVMALADQRAGTPHGFANPALYAAAGTAAFYDPQPVTGLGVVRVDFANGTDDADGTITTFRTLDTTVDTILRARVGYDDITGVGTPNGVGFLNALRR
jgi:subtilase family serine protease